MRTVNLELRERIAELGILFRARWYKFQTVCKTLMFIGLPILVIPETGMNLPSWVETPHRKGMMSKVL